MTLSVAGAATVVTFFVILGSKGDSKDTTIALSSSAVRDNSGDHASASGATLTPPRIPVDEPDQMSAAEAEEGPPSPRRRAEAWMAARNSGHVQTVDQRLNEIASYRKQFSDCKGDSFLRYQYMVALASVAVATHLDELGQATTSALEPTDREWSTGVGGATYVFERGRYPAYDAVMEALNAALKDPNTERETLGFLAAAPPIAAETIDHLNAFVDSAVLLLTRTE